MLDDRTTETTREPNMLATKSHQSIPDEVLDRLVTAMPHLQPMVGNLRRMRGSRLAWGIEKQLASNAMLGPAAGVLTPLELLAISKCISGDKYGGGGR